MIKRTLASLRSAVTGTGRATVQRYVAAFRDGGLEGLRRWDVHGPVSDLADYTQQIRASFEEQPAATIAEACERVERVTGLRREPTQVRKFLKDMGFGWKRTRAMPVPPKKLQRNTRATSRSFSTTS